MKRYAKPNTELPIAASIETPLISDVSIQRLIDDCLVALHREVKNIMIMGVKGKLAPETARDLRDHLKLLFELKDREADSLRQLTDEQLKELYDKEKDIT